MIRLFLLVLGSILTGTLSAQNVIIAAADIPWAPFRTVDEAGMQQGLIPEAVNMILKDSLGLTPQYKFYPWARAQDEVRVGAADIMITLKTPARLEYALASDSPLYSIYFKIFTRADHPRMQEILSVRTLEDIRRLGLTTVSNQGNNWHKANIEALGIPTQYVKDDVSIVRILEAARADIAVDSPLSMGPLIKAENLHLRIVETDVKFEEQWFYLFLSRKSVLVSLWPKINQAVTDVTGSGKWKELLKAAFAPYENRK